MATRTKRVAKNRQRRETLQRKKRSSTLRREKQALDPMHPIYRCVVNPDWRSEGMASLLFARQIAPGSTSIASFLVDTWALGLKDLFGETHVPSAEFDDMAERMRKRIGAEPVDENLARHLVFGGIELARRHGFRLPRGYERWSGLLGPLPDGVAPDMSLFLRDGKIVVTCPIEQLNERLTGCSVQAFLSRPDVLLEAPNWETADGNDAEEFDARMEQMLHALCEDAREWCFASKLVAHPLLESALRTMFGLAASMVDEFEGDENLPLNEAASMVLSESTLQSLVQQQGVAEPVAVAAVDQASRFLNEAGLDGLFEAAVGE